MHKGLKPLVMALVVLALIGCGAEPTPTPVAETATPEATATATPLPTLTPVRTPDAPGLYVDVGQVQGPISPLVYGTNYGPWLFVPLQMQPAAIDANLKIIRYPGGNWGDLNDLDEWSIDQFIAFCKQMGAEANIHVRLRGGTAQKAADLVKLVNVTKGYGVRFWTIGNEPNLYKEVYTVEDFNRDWREWATAMEAVDPSIILIGPEINQFIANPDNPYEQELEDWAVEFLKVNGDMVDIVSFHRYPFPHNVMDGPPTADQLRVASREYDELIPAMRALVREYAGRDLPIGVTEANSSWAASSSAETSLDSHLNAIYWGDSLGRMIRQGAYMVNQFAIAGEFGLMTNYEVRPIYYVYAMYKHFGTTLAFAGSDDPGVSIFAATREDGALTLMIINTNAEAVEKPLTVDGFSQAQTAETWLFDKEHPAEQIELTVLGADPVLTLPPESMMLLILEQIE